MIRTLLTVLVLTVLSTPVFAGTEELDGKGLECKTTKDGSIIYIIFEKGVVFQPHAGESGPTIAIIRKRLGVSLMHPFTIAWGNNVLLNRNTLELQIDSKKYATCELKIPKEINSILQKEVDALKERMKKNKI